MPLLTLTTVEVVPNLTLPRQGGKGWVGLGLSTTLTVGDSRTKLQVSKHATHQWKERNFHFLIFFIFKKNYIKQTKNKRNMSYAHDDGWRPVRYRRRGCSCQQLPFSDPRMRGERRYGEMEHAFRAPPMGEQILFASPNRKPLPQCLTLTLEP